MDSSSRAYQKAPAYPRASSRTSNRSASHARTASQGVRSPAPHFAAPQFSDHPTHRFHHNPCNKPLLSPRSTPRNTPPPIREGSVEPTRTQAVSSFLQEKLQRERRAESDKLSQSPLSRVNEDLGASVELGRVSSPRRRSVAASSDGSRPKSSGGAGIELAKKPGLGVKDMEHVRQLSYETSLSIIVSSSVVANPSTGHLQPSQAKLRPETRTLPSPRKAVTAGNNHRVSGAGQAPNRGDE
jgi:hypothetical protein